MSISYLKYFHNLYLMTLLDFTGLMHDNEIMQKEHKSFKCIWFGSVSEKFSIFFAGTEFTTRYAILETFTFSSKHLLN